MRASLRSDAILDVMHAPARLQPFTAAAFLAMAMLVSITAAMTVSAGETSAHRVACVSGLVASGEHALPACDAPGSASACLSCGTLPGAWPMTTPTVSAPAAWRQLSLPPPTR
jgi:hypothetical protein